MIEKQNFFYIFRKEYGGFESEAFQKALDSDPGEMISVTFPITEETIPMPRKLVETYASWAKVVRKPELDLVSYCKPEVRKWILNNRELMCKNIIEGIDKYHPDHHGITIVWPIHTPDKIPFDVAEKYLKWYNIYG